VACHQQVNGATQQAPGEAIDEPILHEGTRLAEGQEPVAVLPAGEGAAHLHLEETEGRVAFPHEATHGERQSQAA